MARKRPRRYAEWFTEEVWLTCKDSYALGSGLQGLVLDGCAWLTDRKVYLFEVACARRVAHLLPSNLCRRTVDLAEAAADAAGGPLAVTPLPTLYELSAEMDQYGPPPDFLPRPPPDPLTNAGLELAAKLAQPEQLGARVRYLVGGWAAEMVAVAAGVPGSDDEIGQQLLMLHDIFGNPFRPPNFDPGWRTPTVVAMAERIYEERGFGLLPILADALEEAGCANAEMLAHCRGSGPHVRGCWIVDLLLGKE